MFKKVLVANRGDIAVRIIRTLRLMGISPISIFAENDKHSLHVRLSDEAFNLGSGILHDTYMNREKIIDAALWLEADAIHPGYAFLSDDPVFAEDVNNAGISFVGPSASVLTKLNGKLEAKKLAKKVGFKTLPDSSNPISSLDEARKICETIGYPITIKSVYGGGGLGIRVVHSEKDLEKSIDAVKGLGTISFTNNDVFIEKFVEPARDIEFGFIADSNQENTVIFPEIDVSLQYQNQKLVAESPCLVLSSDERDQIHELIHKFVRTLKYDSLGNIEFLFHDNELYFIESNNHIQLEHPLTELLTQIDTIRNQIRIAQREKLEINQSDMSPKGHAFSFRINAEDPIYDFSPTMGTVNELELPGGPGVRFDSNIYRGYTLTPEYDTFIGQLAIYGEDRDLAIQRSEYALKELSIVGPPTTLVFHRHLIQHPLFKSQDFKTSFLIDSDIMEKIREEYYAAAAALFSVRKQTSKVFLPPLGRSRWRDSARQNFG